MKLRLVYTTTREIEVDDDALNYSIKTFNDEILPDVHRNSPFMSVKLEFLNSNNQWVNVAGDI